MLFPNSILLFLLIIFFYSSNYAGGLKIKPGEEERLLKPGINPRIMDTKRLLPPPVEPPTRTRSVDSYFDKNEPVGENFSAEGPWNKPPMPSKSNPNMHKSHDAQMDVNGNNAEQTMEGNWDNNGRKYAEIFPYNGINQNGGNGEEKRHLGVNGGNVQISPDNSQMPIPREILAKNFDGGHQGQIIPHNGINQNGRNGEQNGHLDLGENGGNVQMSPADNSLLLQREIPTNGRETMELRNGPEMIPNFNQNGGNGEQKRHLGEHRGNMLMNPAADNSLLQKEIPANGRETMLSRNGLEIIPNLSQNGNNDQQLVPYSGMPKKEEKRKEVFVDENVMKKFRGNGEHVRNLEHGIGFKPVELNQGNVSEIELKLPAAELKNVDGKEATNANLENGNNFEQWQNNLLEYSKNGADEHSKNGHQGKGKEFICNLGRQGINHFSNKKSSKKVLDIANKCTHFILEIGKFHVEEGKNHIKVKNYENIIKNKNIIETAAMEFKKNGVKFLASWNFGSLNQEHKKVFDNQIQRGGQMFKKTKKTDDRVHLIRQIIEKSNDSIFDGILLDFSEFTNFNNFYADLLRDFYLELIVKKPKKYGRRIFAIRLDNDVDLFTLKHLDNAKKIKLTKFGMNLKYADLVIVKPIQDQQGKEIFDLAKLLVENLETLKNAPTWVVEEYWKTHKNFQKIAIGLPMGYEGKCEEQSAGVDNKEKNRRKRAVLTPIEGDSIFVEHQTQTVKPNPLLRPEMIQLMVKNINVEFTMECSNEGLIELVHNV